MWLFRIEGIFGEIVRILLKAGHSTGGNMGTLF
jgi:hypothetical protein